MNILITGGAGYIGNATTREFLKYGYKVIVYDNLSKGHKKFLPENIVFIEGDLNDKKKIKEIIFKYEIDFVIHLAAYAEAGESVHKPSKYFYNNVINTIILLEAMLESGIKNIVFSSSAAVYGNPKKFPITEDSEISPMNPYGETKMLMENILLEFVDKYKFNSVALRYFNAAGALEDCGENHNPETHIIPRFIKAGLKGDSITIFGDGSHRRDYIHIKDLAKAHVLSLELIKEKSFVNKEGFFDVFNLGTGKMYTNLEIAYKTLEMIHKKTGKKSESKIIHLEERAGDPKDLMSSNEKAKKYLNWHPEKTEIEEIISDSLNWHMNSMEEYEENNFKEKTYQEMSEDIIYCLKLCNYLTKELKKKIMELLLKNEMHALRMINFKDTTNNQILDLLLNEINMRNKIGMNLIEELKNIS